MQLLDFIKTGKRGRIKGSTIYDYYGTVREETDGRLIFQSEGKPDQNLSMLAAMTGDWELERLPRTFYLGITKIQSHLNLREILQAVERPDGTPPDGKPGDNGEWIKVVEVLE